MVEPTLVVVYGEKKLGKTADLIAAAGIESALYLSMSGALKASRHVLGIAVPEARVKRVTTLEEVIEALTQIRDRGNGRFRTVVVDDLTLLLEHTYLAAKQRYGPSRAFPMWDHLSSLLLAFRAVAREAGVHVLCSAHERPLQIDDSGSRWKGGPGAPSKKQTHALAAVCDVLVRAVPDPKRWPWPVSYEADPTSPTWLQGDRQLSLARRPPNTAEALRAAGYDIPRPAALAWGEPVCEAIAQRILDGADPKDYYRRSLLRLAETHPVEHAYWIVRDAIDRAEIRRATSGVDRFLVLADTKTDESNPFAGISPVINPASTTDAQE